MDEHRVVLIGGGHSHVQVLRAFAKKPEPRARLTLVSDRLEAPYSGMLPGHIAGLYPRKAMHIDLAGLAARCAAELIPVAATGLDRQARRVVLADGRHLPYDTVSLNIGITPDLSSVQGGDRFALALKPIGSLLAKLDEAFGKDPSATGPGRILVVGGGPAGVEIALALRARLARGRHQPQPSIAIAAARGLVPHLSHRARNKLAIILARRDIEVLSPCRITEVQADGARAQDGRWIASDLTIMATAARGQPWLAGTDLPLAPDGSILVRRSLASTTDEAIFAAGDCAELIGERLDKAGVFAVRQAPVLAQNLRLRVRGEPPIAYRPQRRTLALLSTGDRRAVASWGSWFAVEGRWVWWWKDWIDRRFVGADSTS